jgi:hypothetical protein
LLRVGEVGENGTGNKCSIIAWTGKYEWLDFILHESQAYTLMTYRVSRNQELLTPNDI